MKASIDKMNLAAIAASSRDEMVIRLNDQAAYFEEALRSGKGSDLRVRGFLKTKLARIILDELHALLCTKEARYRDVRKKAGQFSKVCLPSVAGFVAAKAGIAIAIASSGVALIALVVFKVGQNSFCKTFSRP